MKNRARVRPLLVLAIIALGLGLGTAKARSQDEIDPAYSSFIDPVFLSGYTFTIGGQPITNFMDSSGGLNLSAVNATNGIFQFGFSNPNSAMNVVFTGTDPFGGNGTDKITGIDGVYLLSNGPNDGKNSVTATLNANGAPIKDYNGSNDAHTWKGGLAPGANFPSYTATNFGSSNYLRMNQDPNWNAASPGSNPEVGMYTYQNIAQSASATGEVFFGMHARDAFGNTAFLILAPPPVPEPAYFQLGGLLALGGLGSAYRRLKKRRKSAQA
ncbi:MAG TPA: hypothetical protein VFA07_12280 [Chthonomonadaceae bacterium]|nr:hypothetical protein [Chthonomonadaceae bacterium]